jgi:predicted Zn-dependent protease
MRKTLIPFLLFAAACGSPEVKLTESEEYFSGRTMAEEIITESDLVRDEALQLYVNKVGLTVAYGSDRPELFNGWTFGVVESDTINAVAAPSGFVFITTAMLKRMENEDELAGVLAHEIAHVCRRDPELALQAQVEAESGSGFFGTLTSIAGSAANTATGGRHGKKIGMASAAVTKAGDYVSTKLWKEGYNRDQEYQADVIGLDFLIHPDVGYNPMAYVDVLKRLAGEGPGTIGGFFSSKTHPNRDERVAFVMEKINSDPKYQGHETNSARTKRFLEKTASIRK